MSVENTGSNCPRCGCPLTRWFNTRARILYRCIPCWDEGHLIEGAGTTNKQALADVRDVYADQPPYVEPLEELYGPGEQPSEKPRPLCNCFEGCPLGEKQPDWDKIHQYVEDMLDNLDKIEEEIEKIR